MKQLMQVAEAISKDMRSDVTMSVPILASLADCCDAQYLQRRVSMQAQPPIAPNVEAHMHENRPSSSASASTPSPADAAAAERAVSLSASGALADFSSSTLRPSPEATDRI